MLEIWNATSSSFANLDTTFSSLTGNEADYYTKHIDQFYFKEAIENSVFRIKGFFVPPHTGEYAFLLRGNKGAKLYVTINTASSMNPDYKVFLRTLLFLHARVIKLDLIQVCTRIFSLSVHLSVCPFVSKKKLLNF